MDRNRFRKKKGMSKEDWLDWLADDSPADKPALQPVHQPQAHFQPQAQPQAQPKPAAPVTHAQPTHHARPPVHTPAPTRGQYQSAVAPAQSQRQPQAVTNTTQGVKPAPAAPQAATPPKPASNATVSIQIHLPSLQSERLRKLVTKLKQGRAKFKAWFKIAKAWLLQQWADNRGRTIGSGVGLAVLVLGLFIPPLFNFGYGKATTDSGSAASANAGGVTTAKYDKPPFEVVRPSNKPKLGTPDGVHAAYDGERNTYSYSDSIGGNGFTVSQQPLPAQFKDGQTAVDTIGPTLNKGVTPVVLKPITGAAVVSTNTKYGSQAIVAYVRTQLVFIQSSHTFKNSEWENYLNTLQ